MLRVPGLQITSGPINPEWRSLSWKHRVLFVEPLFYLRVQREKDHPNLVHSGVVRPSFAVKLAVRGSLSLGYSPVISPHLSRGQRLSWDSRRSRGTVGLGNSCPLVAIVDSMKMEGVRPGCVVLKNDLKRAGNIGD